VSDFDREHVTVALTPANMRPFYRAAHREKIMERHPNSADEVTVLVPPGTGKEAMALIWRALGSQPVSQGEGRSMLDQFCDRLGLEP
jgi:hypothetical protein